MLYLCEGNYVHSPTRQLHYKVPTYVVWWLEDSRNCVSIFFIYIHIAQLTFPWESRRVDKGVVMFMFVFGVIKIEC